MDQRGFFGELIHRRVPQYIGLYIAGVWLSIEMGDWLSEQFTMPERLTTYIFVFTAVMLPSVALFAWNHGAPGKDQARKSELLFVPLNIAVAVAGVWLVPERSPQPSPTVATAEAAAPARPSSVRFVAYFLANNTAEAPDWYAYALPILLSEDLQRESPAFVASTPFDSWSLLDSLRQAGFESAMRVPQSLQLQLARQRRYNYFLRGELTDAPDGRMMFRYALHDVATGEPRVTGEEVIDDETMFAAADRASAAVRAELEQSLRDGLRATELPVSESMSPNVDALRLFTEARIATALDQDGRRGGELLQRAVAADPQFAEAYGALGFFHYLSGENDLAEAAFDDALRYDFRLSRASEFRLKINKAAINGDYAGASEIARTWTRVEPGNESAHRRLAEINIKTGAGLDEALAALETVRDINPLAVETLKKSALLEQQRGNIDAAEELLLQYTSAAPDDASGFVSLAQLQAAKGKFDTALDTYRQAAILDGRSVAPQVGEIDVLMRRGDYAQAEDRLTRLLERDMTDEQRLEVLFTGVMLHGNLGQYDETIGFFEQAEPIMLRMYGPLLATMQVTAPRIAQRGFYVDDPAPVLAELEQLQATLQPPWSDLVSVFEAGVLVAHDDEAGFRESLEGVERFATAQPGNGNLQFMADTYRATAAVYDGDSAAAVTLIRSAIQRSQSSFLAVVVTGEVLSMQAEMYDVMRRAGAVGEAIEGLERIVTSYPGLAIAHLRLAQAYLDVGSDGAARDAIATVKDIWNEADPEFVYLDDVERVESALAETA